MTVTFNPDLIAQAVEIAPVTGDELIYVADSSNIEARMLAWEAGQEDLLEIFRSGGDVYAYTAEDIYGRPIDKKKDPHERFVGKVTALGLGYQMGWRKFKDTLAAGALGGPPVLMEDHEVQHIVNTFRTKRWAIKAYWGQAEQAIIDMYLGNSRQWGPLTIHKNCLVMPNGMALQYPGLRPVEPSEDGTTHGGWEYWNGKFWTKIYGGKLCLAAGTQVLTRQGWQAIELISAGSEVWDGENWVKCDGNVHNGVKPVIELAGIAMTPDHEVLTDEGWKTASQSQGHNRLESRLPDGPGVRWKRWEEIPMASAVCVRGNQTTYGSRLGEVEKAGCRSLLRMQTQGYHIKTHDHARDVETPSLRRLAIHDRPLLATLAPSMAKLRSTWRSGMQAMAGILRGVLGRHGRRLSTGANPGPHRQRPALRTGQLPVGNIQNTSQQPTKLGQDQRQDGEAALSRIGYRGDNPVVSDRAWLALGLAINPAERNQPVYDLINCGPNNRFVVRDRHGKPLIVHNCENITQALARIALFDQMLAINEVFKPHGGRVVLNVHDEVIAVGPSFGARFHGIQDGKEIWTHTEGADELFNQMLTIMRTPPDWCPDLPLDGEGGFAFEYSK